ncbi:MULTISPECIES: shikimate kinase [Bacillus]|jgi:shikimate kinase|uniref:shikimate kinase n=1 Tax=Bacillus TaxID=1386 RepID=UPI00025A997D|nr:MULTISPECIES: shikimate kinase [Bacillus]AKQ71477.1 shikimate kinase [Bacillus licheniformis WX-02]APJ25652.1 shikimate kinase [Bacillus sp. H15-1]ARC66943.1 shikimate kinase [Bacillus licheniformis]ASV13982.1 shikimate kinase [Bacillus sp. 1s-1]AUZ29114.1 shikimate kinase [Bacillus licheniformis]
MNAAIRDKNIVLIGFMGVGKTTIGQLVSKKLGRDFIDIDHEIEKDFQMTIPEMFQQKGEAFFRQTEKEYIFQMCEHTMGNIVSLGGGAFQQEEIRKKCLEHCFVIFLDLRWENWKQRMDLLIEKRPVLHNRTIEEMKQLFNERKSIYAFHHLKVETDNRSAEETADYIVEMLKLGQS